MKRKKAIKYLIRLLIGVMTVNYVPAVYGEEIELLSETEDMKGETEVNEAGDESILWDTFGIVDGSIEAEDNLEITCVEELESSDEEIKKFQREQNENVVEETEFVSEFGELEIEDIKSMNSSGAILDSGICGDNLTWVLGISGTLTISGTGDMYDYAYPNSKFSKTHGDLAPWVKMYSGQISNIIVEIGVTKIGSGAFVCSGAQINDTDGFAAVGTVDSISIPNTVKSIGDRAFWGTGCESFDIPGSIEAISEEVFTASSFCNIIVHMKRIPNGMLQGCGSLLSVTLSDEVTTIGDNAFQSCKNLSSIVFSNRTTSIGNSAFAGCGSLVSIDLPDKVTNIGRYAFEGCGSLTGVIIPASVTSIGTDCFQDCTSLENVIINANMESLSSGVFAGCVKLQSVVLPSSLKSIGVYAFGNCASLSQITIPDHVTDIYSQAFYNCTALTSIAIPASVKNIASGVGGKANIFNAFGGNSNLIAINVEPGNTAYKSYDGCLYNYGLTELLYCPEGKKSVIVADGTAMIGASAFFSSEQYFSGNQAYELAEIYFIGNAPKIDANAWQHISAAVYYPSDNDTWTANKKVSYGGQIAWVAWQPDIAKCNIVLAQSSYTYDGYAKIPTVSIWGGALELFRDVDYSISYNDNRNAGIAVVTITGMGKYSGTVNRTFTIQKVDQSVALNIFPSSIEIGQTAQITVSGRGTISYKTNDESIAVVSGNGKVVALKPGTTSVTVTVSGDNNYNSASKTISVTVLPVNASLGKPEETSHIWDAGNIAKSATCTEDGEKIYTCTGCGEKRREIVERIGHRYDAGNIVKWATCTENGEKIYTCTNCGEKRREVIERIGHRYDSGSITKESTCVAEGIKTYICGNCGIMRTEAVAKSGEHKWSEWKTVSKATVFTAKVQTRICSVCGIVQKRSYGKKLIPKMTVNVERLKLKKNQSTTALKVRSMAKGDYIKSVKSNAAKIVKVVSYKSDGTIKLKAQKNTGTAKLTITLVSGFKKTITVEVQKEAVETTKISGVPKKLTIKKGKKKTLIPVISPITSQQRVVFTSSNKKIASVSLNGVISAKKTGITKITVKSGKKKVIVTVTVKK